jgi:DNA-binding transcriptional LysR family regulator
MVNAHQLNVFLISAETLNFTEAASLLKVSQPSISQHIQSLEQHFGSALFHRSGRTLELTDAGLALIPLAREFLHLSTHIEEIMASIKGDVYGHLRVGCSTIIGPYILPKLLAIFHREYPQVDVTIKFAPQDLILQMLQDGKVHLALTSSSESTEGVDFRKFIKDHIVVIVPIEHPWVKKQSITTGELIESEFIFPEEGSETHKIVRDALASIGLSIFQLKYNLALDSPEGILFSVEEGLGAGFVSMILVNKLNKNKVRQIQIKGLDITYDIYIGYHPSRLQTSAQVAFCKFLETYIITSRQVLLDMNWNEIITI